MYDNTEFAEISEKLREKPGLYGDQEVVLIELDKNGKIIPKMDNAASEDIAKEFLRQLGNWNLTLPRQNRVYLHSSRTGSRFNQERRMPDVGVSTNFTVAYNEKRRSLVNPLQSPNFAVEICREENKSEAEAKIRNSYLVAGTNTTVAMLIYHADNEQIAFKFFVKRNNQCNCVLGPMWGDWNSAIIPELDDIIPGFTFSSEMVMDVLRNFE